MKKLEYIQSTGTQYIDTGILPSPNLRVEMKYQYVDIDVSKEYCTFGSWSVDGLLYGVNGGYVKSATHNGWVASSVIPDNNIHIFSVKDDGIYYDETQINSALPTDYSQSIFLCRARYPYPDYTNFPNIKIYYCKLYNNDTLVRDFIPAEDDSNVVCLYDNVTQQYFYNQGTGDFIAGGEIVVKQYLIENDNKVYTVTDGALVEVGVPDDINAALFESNGFTDISSASTLLAQLSAPSVLIYDSNEEVSASANVKAIPKPQTVITNEIPLSKAGVTSIESVECESAGTPTFAVSADGVVWKSFIGGMWTTLNESTSGMQASTLTSITSEQWGDFINGLTSMFFRFTLSANDSVTKVQFNYTANAVTIKTHTWRERKKNTWGELKVMTWKEVKGD